MSEAQAGPSGANRRARKRRRRAKSYSVDSSSDEDDSSQDEGLPSKAEAVGASADPEEDDSDDDSEDTDSEGTSDSSDSDSDEESARQKALPKTPLEGKAPPRQARYPTLSPSPPPHRLPPFLAKRPEGPSQGEDERRAKFRDVYMTKLVEGFGGDLEQMRAADPNLNSDRLQRLIESLQSGMDVFNDPQRPNGKDGDGVDEVGVIIGQK